ncbi:PPOX class F420-dependent oxidoreductase [Agrococcus sp. Marseille-P2731]|uniref:PPOX class F420-dependent oxidoreductase n=1 Tax=Agrococcus sp. Marseille-P2731 TaxID=1841862 RepID=UPI000931F18A|nr:PPOX class F420-dependent oxidoreductase [Agrococcus sp. Marseille-P2731]
MTSIPEQYRYLTDAPLFAHLATVRPDGSAQSNPMWFKVVGDEIRFTHTSKRQKYKNLQANPTMSLSITDPEQPHLYVELRGHLAGVIEDPTGAFYVELQNHYGNPSEQAPPDAADRVILRMAIDKVTGRV